MNEEKQRQLDLAHEVVDYLHPRLDDTARELATECFDNAEFELALFYTLDWAGEHGIPLPLDLRAKVDEVYIRPGVDWNDGYFDEVMVKLPLPSGSLG